MRREAKIVSLGPVEDPSVVNLMCLLMLQSGDLAYFLETEACECAVCREFRLNGVSGQQSCMSTKRSAHAAG